VATTASGAFAAPKKPRPLERKTAKQALAILLAGNELHFIEVTTPVKLPRSVPNPFVCTPCTFDKSLSARDVTFKSLVDLRGAKFDDSVDASGATFGGRTLFGPFPDTSRRSSRCPPVSEGLLCFVDGDIAGTANFSLATFKQAVSFENVNFEDRTEFSLAQFRDEADFSKTEFDAPALFDEARFAQPVSFLGADLDRLEFEYVRSPSTVDFDQAGFACTNEPTKDQPKPCTTATENRPGPSDAVFTYSNLGGLSFSHASFDPGAQLWMTGLATPSLVLAPGDVHHVLPADRDRVLGMIESTAKADGDLGTANEADYRLHVLRSNGYSQPERLLDFVFFRSMGGYLVEPLQPLLTLLGIALLVSLLRVLLPRQRLSRLRLRAKLAWSERGRRRPEPRAPRPAPHARRSVGTRLDASWSTFCRYAHELLDTLSLMWPWSGASVAGRRLEANLYRILFVCFLIGLANSNPTLRQMLDALH